MRKNLVISSISLIIAALVGVSTFKNRYVLGSSTNFTASEIISIANATRQLQGITPLHPNPALMKAAEAKANAMLQANAWSHNTPTQTPWQFIDNEGYVYLIAGENLAKDFYRAEDVISAWMNSPSHRDNLLNAEYTETGVAVVEGAYQNKDKTTLVVQYLARAYVPGVDEPRLDQNYFAAPLLEKVVSSVTPLRFLTLFLAAGLILLASIITISILMHKPKNPKPPHISHWSR